MPNKLPKIKKDKQRQQKDTCWYAVATQRNCVYVTNELKNDKTIFKLEQSICIIRWQLSD